MSIVDGLGGLGPSLDARVIYRSREEAEKETGYFSVSAVKVTADLSERICSYIRAEGLQTYTRENKRKTSYNYYTLKFTLRLYYKTSSKNKYQFGWLTDQAALGHLKPRLANFGFPIPAGGGGIVKNLAAEAAKEHEDLKKRTPEFEQMYFWICRKYPGDVITVRYRTEPA